MSTSEELALKMDYESYKTPFTSTDSFIKAVAYGKSCDADTMSILAERDALLKRNEYLNKLVGMYGRIDRVKSQEIVRLLFENKRMRTALGEMPGYNLPEKTDKSKHE